MHVPRLVLLTSILLAVAIGLGFLTYAMRRMKPRAQFMVLLVLGVIIGFTFFAMVQLPRFPLWLGISLVVIVLTTSPFAVRTFVRSLIQDDEQENGNYTS